MNVCRGAFLTGVVAVGLSAWASSARAQETPREPPQAEARVAAPDEVEAVQEAPAVGTTVIGIENVTSAGLDRCSDGRCCPATTRERLLIGASSAALFAVLFILFRTAVVATLIRRGWRPRLASHAALSGTLFATSAGASVVAYAIHGCWSPGFNFLAAFFGVVWLIHLGFTMAVVPSRA